MTKPIDEILAPKPQARPRIYAYSIDGKAHKGLLKVGQTTRDVKHRVAEQLKTASIKNFGAWRDAAKELFEGEEESSAKKEAKLEYGGALEEMNEDLTASSVAWVAQACAASTLCGGWSACRYIFAAVGAPTDRGRPAL